MFYVTPLITNPRIPGHSETLCYDGARADDVALKAMEDNPHWIVVRVQHKRGASASGYPKRDTLSCYNYRGEKVTYDGGKRRYIPTGYSRTRQTDAVQIVEAVG